MSWAGWLIDFYDLFLYTFVVASVVKDLNITKGAAPYVLGAPLAASAVGGLIFGVLSDRFGRKTILQWTIVTFSVGTLLTGFALNLKTLLFARIVTGLGVGGEWATGETYVSETFPPRMRGRYGAFMQAGAPVGVALAAIVGGFAAPAIGWRACFLLSSLPALMIIVIRKRLPESDLWQQRKNLNSRERDPVNERWRRVFQLFKKPHRKLFTFALVLAIFDMTSYWLTFSWLPTYLEKQRHLTIGQSTGWMVWTQISILVGCATFGFVADRLGRRPAYSIYCSLMALGLVMITLFWKAIELHPSTILLFMFLVGFGTGNFGGYGPLFSELFPTGIRNTALGTAFNTARGLQFFSPIIIATIASVYGFDKGIAIAAIFALLTGIWIWMLPETKGWRLAD